MGLADVIRNYFDTHPRAKKALGVATAIATNFAMIASGSPLLALAAGVAVKHQEDKDKVRSSELLDFFKEAIQDPQVRNSLKDAVGEGDVAVASNVAVALNQLGAARPETGQFVDTMKSELTVVLQQIGIIREMVSYFEIPDSFDRVKNVWRLPSYIDEVLVIDSSLKAVLDTAVGHIKEGENLVILGAPGSGKTTALYAIWKELDEESDTALVWDTKDVSRIHEKSGVLLFNDDIPETRELMKAIVERDVHGLVTTAREQEWSRLPVELREKFTSVSIPMMSDEVMAQIASKHLESQSIKFNQKALKTLVENAQGSPIYVRYMAEEIAAEGTSNLTESRVKQAPKGMSDYVAGILARILFDLEGTIYKPKQGSLPVLKTLLCLADMPNYETHEVHINQVFFKVKAPSDSAGPFNAVKQYLARDPRFFSLKFMHDTLADVLRGRVDHPIVGDIRMLAQEMGASGRRNVEREALADGWEHVKGEYELDVAGGLEPLLAYGYFAVKNFGIDNLDRSVIDLANKHIENPLSQGLFALTGPNIDQIPTIETRTSPKPEQEFVELSQEQQKSQETVSKVPTSKSISEEIKSGLKELEKLEEYGKVGETISKLVESKLSGVSVTVEAERKTKFEALEEMLKQESVRSTRLARALRKASLRAKVLHERGKLVDPEKTGDLLIRGAEKLVLLDSMDYIEILPELSEGLSGTMAGVEVAKELARITQEIDVSLLDDKTRKDILKVFDIGTRRCEKIGDYEGMKEFLKQKWQLFGIDPKDIDYASKQFGQLMKLDRTVFAFENIIDFNDYFNKEQVEYKVGIALQAFKNLSGANISDRSDFDQVIGKCITLFQKSINTLEAKELLHQNETAGDLCTTLLSSTVSAADTLVKKSGKSVAAEAVYPLLHKSMEPLFMSVYEALEKIGIKKTNKTASNIVGKIKGESDHKNQLLAVYKSPK
ncbi:MAG: ATP-binding cassette domain-containing protein [Candidatus Thorarchaeota archaeon]|jgi:energy-coupling factor transporter ATP-binding protein EcfA2